MDGRGFENLHLVQGDGSDLTVSEGKQTENAKKKPSTEVFFLLPLGVCSLPSGRFHSAAK